MPVALTSIRDLLRPGLYAVDGKYDMIPQQWNQVFTTRKSTMAVERKVQNRFLGLAQLKSEGGQTSFDNNAGERLVYNAESFEVGLGYAITRKAIDDNLYKSEFNPTNLQMLDSFNQFKEIQAANIFNNGTTYDTDIGGDGKALFATDHPVDGSTVANTFSSALDLNESSLLQGMTNIRSNFVNEAGLKIYARAQKLLVAPAAEPIAIRLTKTELRPGTANNDVNAILSTAGGLPQGYMAWDYLTSQTAWFLLTNYAKDALLMMQRIKFETDMQVDFITDNLLVKGYERYTPTYNDWRAAYGSFPSS